MCCGGRGSSSRRQWAVAGWSCRRGGDERVDLQCRTTQRVGPRRLRHGAQALRRRGDRTSCAARSKATRRLRESLYDRRDAVGQGHAHGAVEPPGRQRLRPGRTLAAHRRHHGRPAGRRGLPLPLQAHRQGAARRRRLGMAPGLRLLVPQRHRLPAHGQRHGRAGPRHARERLPAGGEGLAPLRPHRARRAARRAGRRRPAPRARRS